MRSVLQLAKMSSMAWLERREIQGIVSLVGSTTHSVSFIACHNDPLPSTALPVRFASTTLKQNKYEEELYNCIYIENKVGRVDSALLWRDCSVLPNSAAMAIWCFIGDTRKSVQSCPLNCGSSANFCNDREGMSSDPKDLSCKASGAIQEGIEHVVE